MVKAIDSNERRYLFLYEGAGSNPAGVVFCFRATRPYPTTSHSVHDQARFSYFFVNFFRDCASDSPDRLLVLNRSAHTTRAIFPRRAPLALDCTARNYRPPTPSLKDRPACASYLEITSFSMIENLKSPTHDSRRIIAAVDRKKNREIERA